MRLTDHAAAAAELAEAAEFYERRMTGLGTRFAEAVQRTLAAVQENPSGRAPVEADVRSRRVPEFPYAIYYRILSDRIQVLAYKHHSRHPDYWLGRLND